MLLIFQILFSLFALVAMFSVIQKRREGLLGPLGALFWVLFWLVASLVVWWPDSATQIANLLGIGRGTDFVLYIAIVVLFYLIFKLHIKLESIGRSITKIVRKEAIEGNEDQKI